MALFTRRRPAAAPGALEWIPLTGVQEELTETFGDENAAGDDAYGVTFYTEGQPDTDLTVWLYPAWDEDGELAIARRFVHRCRAEDPEPWSGYVTDAVYADDRTFASAEDAAGAAFEVATWYAEQPSVSGPPDAGPGEEYGFGWDGVPW